MPRVGFESTIAVFERAKTVHASDRAATVIGLSNIVSPKQELDALREVRSCLDYHSHVYSRSTRIESRTNYCTDFSIC
jgi:hypothetical protein